MLRRVVQSSSASASRVLAARPLVRKTAVRQGHGQSHGHAHANEPYAMKHHDHYPDEAYAFGIKPGDSAEGWEYLTYGVYAACTLILVLGMNMKANDDFKAWARREALAREKVVENGGEIEFGKYHAHAYESAGDCGDTMPTIKEE